MITPNESVTWVPRNKPKDGPSHVPLLLIVGDSSGRIPPLRQRVTTFAGTLVVGRREAAKLETGQTSLVLPDRMVSGQHLAIGPAPEEGSFEITDLSSTNGTVVDGEAVDSTVKLRDGAVIFVGSHVMVFRVATVAQLSAIEEELSRPLGPVATVNPAFASVCKRIRKLAEAGQEFLLTGETGAGKEIYANAIHRGERPQRAVRGGQLRGAAARAGGERAVRLRARRALAGGDGEARHHRGRREGGTLFLDEIGEMPPELQTKLLRFTQDRMLTPIGGDARRATSTRASSRRPAGTAPTESGSGGLRADLAARLGAEPIRIPPLRDRIEDLGALAHVPDKRQARRPSSCRRSSRCASTAGRATCASSARSSSAPTRWRATRSASASSTCPARSRRCRGSGRRPGAASTASRPAPRSWRR